MRRLSVILALLPLSIALASPALAADPDKGKVLVAQKCTGCHCNGRGSGLEKTVSPPLVANP